VVEAGLTYSLPKAIDSENGVDAYGEFMSIGRCAAQLIVVGSSVLGPAPMNGFAGEPVTVVGTVSDISGNPLKGVNVSVVANGIDGPLTGQSKKNGKFTIDLPDFDLTYEFTFTKEGFEPASLEFVPGPGDLGPLEVILALAGEISEARERAIPVFNEGVTALEAGDRPAALGKFQEASEIDPDFVEASSAAAAIAMELENFAVAADAGENLVRLQPDNLDAISTAYFAELMLNDMERFIPSARRLAAANPQVVSNEMVQHATVLFDNNELAGSRALLELIIEQEPDLAAAHLQLGLVCNMSGDPACAKEALGRYLEIDPDGTDAATARSLLEYLR
jgi:Tfp pilus assembly protein PilF